MRTLFHCVMTLGWALWLGALVAVFLVATNNFRVFDRATAGDVNLAMFAIVERWQLVVAAVSIVAAVALLMRGKTRSRAVTVLLLSAAGVGVLLSNLWISPAIESLRAGGQVGTPQWGKMHGMSMMVYSTQVGILVLAGLAMPFTRDEPTKSPGNGGTGPAASAG